MTPARIEDILREHGFNHDSRQLAAALEQILKEYTQSNSLQGLVDQLNDHYKDK